MLTGIKINTSIKKTPGLTERVEKRGAVHQNVDTLLE